MAKNCARVADVCASAPAARMTLSKSSPGSCRPASSKQQRSSSSSSTLFWFTTSEREIASEGASERGRGLRESRAATRREYARARAARRERATTSATKRARDAMRKRTVLKELEQSRAPRRVETVVHAFASFASHASYRARLGACISYFLDELVGPLHRVSWAILI